MNSELAFKYDIINICDKSSKNKEHLSNLLILYNMLIETKD